MFSPEVLKAVLRKTVPVARKDISHPIGEKNRRLANPAALMAKLLFPAKLSITLPSHSP